MAGKTYIVDRFEDDWAVLEIAEGETFNVPRVWLPEDAAEGDVLQLSLETESARSAVQFSVDAEETAARRRHVQELRDSLLKAPDGDLEL